MFVLYARTGLSDEISGGRVDVVPDYDVNWHLFDLPGDSYFLVPESDVRSIYDLAAIGVAEGA